MCNMIEDAKDILGFTAYDDQESSTATAITTTAIPWSLPLNAPMLLDQWGLIPSSFETAFSHHQQFNMLSASQTEVHQRQQQSQRQTSYIDPLTAATTNSLTTTNMTLDQSALQYLGHGQHQTEASNDGGATNTVATDTFFDAGAYLQSHPGDVFDWTEFTTADMMPFQPSRINQLSESPFFTPMHAASATSNVAAADQISQASPLAAGAPVQTPMHTPLAPELGQFAVGHHSPESFRMEDRIISSPGSARSGDTNAVSDPGSWFFVDGYRGPSDSPTFTNHSHGHSHEFFVNPSQMLHNRSTLSLTLSDSSFSDLGALGPAGSPLSLGSPHHGIPSNDHYTDGARHTHSPSLTPASSDEVGYFHGGVHLNNAAVHTNQSAAIQQWIPPAPWSDHHPHHHHTESDVSVNVNVNPVNVVRQARAARPSSNSSSSASAPKPANASSQKSRRRAATTAKSQDTRVRKCAHSHSSSTSSIASTASAVSLISAADSTDAPPKKRIGKRTGPLKPDQRKQASEIRKLRACLRCKFLKKTCDKGEPCAGCKPSHARLWQVPCTRIDIKDIAYFLKDWKADYFYLPPSESPTPSLASLLTILESIDTTTNTSSLCHFSNRERTLFITHGYGHSLPVKAREICVTDDSCLEMKWVETYCSGTGFKPPHFKQATSRMCCTDDSVSQSLLSEYLDNHLDMPGSFEQFVDGYFAGTPFVTEMLKTSFRFYVRTGSPIIRKALKLVIAYNLTMNVTLLEGIGELDLNDHFKGQVQNQSSLYAGRIMAPILINFAIKRGLAKIWRELQKEVLEDLSSLYSSVYSGEKLKNWPTIFFLAVLVLGIWEEIQFDSHYRMSPESREENKAGEGPSEKFCADMEGTPIGVIVGLFQAISQKVPSFMEWDTSKHGNLFNHNADVCDALTEVREHVSRYEPYLRTRSDSKFDADDFDSLSNKFVSRLVIRAN